MATSIAVLSSWALVPKASSMLATDTPAAAATERTVVAAYPRLANCSVAAAMMRPRVCCAWAVRCGERYTRLSLRRGWFVPQSHYWLWHIHSQK